MSSTFYDSNFKLNAKNISKNNVPRVHLVLIQDVLQVLELFLVRVDKEIVWITASVP